MAASLKQREDEKLMAMNLGMPPHMNPGLFGPGDIKRPRLDPNFALQMNQSLPLGPPVPGQPYPDMTSPGFLPPTSLSMPGANPFLNPMGQQMSQPISQSQPITPNSSARPTSSGLSIEQSPKQPEKIKEGVFNNGSETKEETTADAKASK